jgi:hypothetical protein
MSVSVCPIAAVRAPVEKVWSFLSEPANYALWWNAQTKSITPPGHARPGQRIDARSKSLGTDWPVSVVVEGIEESAHRIHLQTRLPFGITVYNHITCVPVDAFSCQVSFG